MFKDVKDGDKVALLILFTGLVITFVGTGFVVLVVFYVHTEGLLDRIILTIGTLTAQGTGLVTAAMGVLRFQSKGGDGPPAPPAK